jgi:hypothetical protein
MATSATPMTINTILPATPVDLQGHWIGIQIPKALLVATPEELKTMLQRGKWWKRHAQLKARLAAEEDPR